MDATQLRFLQLFGELAKVNPTNTLELQDRLVPIIKLEFELGILVWEYLIKTHHNTYVKDKTLSQFLGDDVLKLFYNNSVSKTINAITDPDIPDITEFVFEYNPMVTSGIVLQLVLESTTSSNSDKQSLAHIYLSHISRNRNVNFGDYLKIVTEHAIDQHIRKLSTKSKNMPFPRKQATLLLQYIDKVKGAQKSLLTQRIKEIS
jgi:hypothetical protein